MAFFDAQPVTSASSTGFSFSTQTLVADPFTASNITWTEVENSTSEAWGGFYVVQSGFNAHGIVLIATGAASSESIIASMPFGASYQLGSSLTYVPIPVASGTRISIGGSTQAAATCRGQIIGIPSTNFDSTPSFTVMESGPYDLENDAATYGRFAKIDPGGTANTKGSYTEISVSGTNAANNVIQGDSLGQSYDWLGMRFGENWNNAQTVQNRLWDVAHGAASSETIFAADFWDRLDALERVALGTEIVWVPWGRASGDRISARMQCDITDANDRIGSLCLFGLR